MKFKNTKKILIIASLILLVGCQKDQNKPVMTLIGEPEIIIDYGSIYIDQGVEIVDNKDKDLITEVYNDVNTRQLGEYIINYNVTDEAGNIAEEVSRKVIVTTPKYCFEFAEEESTIKDYLKGVNCLKKVLIPPKINNIAVTTIGKSALSDKGLTEITIPNTVTTINEYAFSSNSLTSVAISKNVKTIKFAAFDWRSLNSFNIDSDNTGFKMENSALVSADGTILYALIGIHTSFTVPKSVERIESYAFYKNNLSSLILPKDLKTIGAYAVTKNKLTAINLPNSIVEIGDYAFHDNRIEQLAIPTALTTVGKWSFSSNNLSFVDIPSGVITIDEYAFYGNDLTKINIPNSVIAIKEGSFLENGLKEITISATVTDLGFYSFDWGTIPSLKVDPNNPKYKVIGSSLLSKDEKLLYGVLGKHKNYLIPETIEIIGDYAFSNNELESIIIPSNVKTIGEWAFYKNNLTEIEISDTVEEIKDWAFSTNRLERIILPDNTTTINDWVFYNNNLTELTISENVKTIGEKAFGKNNFSKIEILGPNKHRFDGKWGFYGFPRELKKVDTIIPV